MKNFLGVKISDYDLEGARAQVRDFLRDGQHKIFTPNPEMIVKAQKDEYFREVLNSGDLNLCDGKGLEMFAKIKRITGVDFMQEICKIAEEQGRSVYLLGSGNDNVVKKTADELLKKFPGLKISGFDKGLPIREIDSKLAFDEVENDILIQKINSANPDVLFIAFGMGKQEK